MRIAAPISPIRAIAHLPRARAGHGQEQGATVPVAARLAVTPMHATVSFLAQTIAQELMATPSRAEHGFAAAYLPQLPAAFEGLNFRTVV